MISAPRSTALFVWLLVVALSACGGAAPSPTTATPPSRELGELSVQLAPAVGGAFAGEVSENLQALLLGAGYRLVQAGQAPDVTLQPSVTSAEEPSFLQVTVNGRRQVKYRVHVTMTVTISSRVVDQLSAEFVASPEHGREANLSGMVSALSASPALERAARGVLEQRRSAERARADALANDERAAGDALWSQANVMECRMPSKLAACDGVRLYLAKFERGPHAIEAVLVLREAEPTLARLQRDENQWQSAHADACGTRPSLESCTGVELYLTKFPAGLHGEEAHRLLAAVPR